MNEEARRKLASRLHRLEGQVRGVEKSLGESDPLLVLSQFEAVIAAAQSSLGEYVNYVLDQEIPTEIRTKVIKRISRR